MRAVGAALALWFVACGPAEKPSTPAVAPPMQRSDIVGIWRTIHQGVLELRDNGSMMLISPITEPMGGRYQLRGDRLSVTTDGPCGDATGTYSVSVAVSNRLELTEPDDPCAARRRVMTTDPWVYTPR